jgi:hypothetical protein
LGRADRGPSVGGDIDAVIVQPVFSRTVFRNDRTD